MPVSVQVRPQPILIQVQWLFDKSFLFLKVKVCFHWAVLLFNELNPAPPSSLLSKGEGQAVASVSDRPADRPLRYLASGWSKVNWGSGVQSLVREGCLATGERVCVCGKGMLCVRTGACGWIKICGLIGICGCVGVNVCVGVSARVGVYGGVGVGVRVCMGVSM